jgi:hypothetical protein
MDAPRLDGVGFLPTGVIRDIPTRHPGSRGRSWPAGASGRNIRHGCGVGRGLPTAGLGRAAVPQPSVWRQRRPVSAGPALPWLAWSGAARVAPLPGVRHQPEARGPPVRTARRAHVSHGSKTRVDPAMERRPAGSPRLPSLPVCYARPIRDTLERAHNKKGPSPWDAAAARAKRGNARRAIPCAAADGAPLVGSAGGLSRKVVDGLVGLFDTRMWMKLSRLTEHPIGLMSFSSIYYKLTSPFKVSPH